MRVDDAAVAGLAALGFPRGPVRAVRVESVGRGWLGRKVPDCDILFDELVLDRLAGQEQADRLFKTWLHESLHARALPVLGVAAERRDFRGYEEGLSEGIARLVTHEKAAIPHFEAAYTYYVEAYHTLAVVLGLDLETLWRQLWTYAPGAVRDGLMTLVDRYLESSARTASRTSIMALADALFATRRLADEPDPDMMIRAWTSVIDHGT
jgi:hypothetical protein